MKVRDFKGMVESNQMLANRFFKLEMTWNRKIAELFPKTATTAGQVHNINKLSVFPLVLSSSEPEIEMINAMLNLYKPLSPAARQYKMFSISQRFLRVENLTIIDYKKYMNCVVKIWRDKGIVLKKDGAVIILNK